jgi:competence protein ComEA
MKIHIFEKQINIKADWLIAAALLLGTVILIISTMQLQSQEKVFPASSDLPPATESSQIIVSISPSNIPSATATISPTPTIEQEDKLVNINTATLEELDTLIGIGPVKAQAIIDYRVEHGGFKTIDELLEVKGIGEKTLEKLKDKVTL